MPPRAAQAIAGPEAASCILIEGVEMNSELKPTRSWIGAAAFGGLGLCVALAGLTGAWPGGELKAQGYPMVDLGLSAAVTGAPTPGGSFGINYSVSNAGPNAAHGVVLVVQGKAKILSTNGCVEDPLPKKWCTVKLPNGELQPGQTTPVFITLGVPAQASGQFVIESMASATEADHNPGNEYNSTTVTIN